MDRCIDCKYATHDYFEYYGTTRKEWFVDGCEKGNDVGEDDLEYCEDYEEREVDYDR